MNWKLIAKHFANGKIDKKKWEVHVAYDGPCWFYIGPQLSPTEEVTALMRMERQYGESGTITAELVAALKALDIPTYL